MKKTTKISVLALFALSFALVFGGCKNTDDETSQEPDSDPKTVKVTEVTFDSGTKTLKVGETVLLKATVKPEDATDKTLKWTSSDSKIATTDENGNVKGVAEGEVVITATANDGSGKSATCKVTVNNEVSSDDDNNNTPTPEVKTKYTNDNWVNDAPKSGANEYPGVFIGLADIGLDENLKLSDYDYVKINVTYSKGGEDLGNIGFVHFATNDDETLSFARDFNKDMGSKYASAYLPITGVINDVSKAQKFMIQCDNQKGQVDKIKVNYIEFVKIPGLKKGVSYDSTWTNSYMKQILNAGASGDTVVFGLAYSDEVEAYNGVFGLADSKWASNSKEIAFSAGGDAKAGMIEEFTVSYDDLKAEADKDFVNLNSYNGAALQYVYIK